MSFCFYRKNVFQQISFKDVFSFGPVVNGLWEQNETGIPNFGMPVSCISNIQQIAVNLQCAVGIVRQDLLGEDLAQLNAFLIEAVQVPGKALEHHLVLKVRQQHIRNNNAA